MSKKNESIKILDESIAYTVTTLDASEEAYILDMQALGNLRKTHFKVGY